MRVAGCRAHTGESLEVPRSATRWIEAIDGNFGLYVQGIGPAVANVMDAIDAERRPLAEALGVVAPPPQARAETPCLNATGACALAALERRAGLAQERFVVAQRRRIDCLTSRCQASHSRAMSRTSVFARRS